MSSQCFVSIFLWVYLLQLMCCVDPEQSSKIPASGPFEILVTSIRDCTNPSKPYLKNPPVIYQLSAHSRTLLSGNVTFYKDMKNVKIRFRGFVLRNGKWAPSYLINNMDCHGMVLHIMCATMKIKYDRKNCLFFKGFYSFENVDVNQLMHVWISKVKYGRILWRIETYSQAGTFTCKEYETMAKPA